MKNKQQKPEPISKKEFLLKSEHLCELHIEAFDELLTKVSLAGADDYIQMLTNKEEILGIINAYESKFKKIKQELEKLGEEE